MDMGQVQMWILCLKGCCFLLIASVISQCSKILFLAVGERSLFNLELCYD